MLELTWGVFVESRQAAHVSSSSSGVSQLLLIVSDGRGIFREGVEKVKKAVRKLMSVGVFIVFVILDKPDMATQQASIMDIRVPIFGGATQVCVFRRKLFVRNNFFQSNLDVYSFCRAFN